MTITMTEAQARKAGIGGKKKAPAHRPGEMNKTEAEYAQKLWARMAAGEIREYHFEKITLKLGPDCRYTLDFATVGQDGALELHEVKGGFMRDDSLVKLRVAVGMFKNFRFYLAQKKNGQWTVKHIRA